MIAAYISQYELCRTLFVLGFLMAELSWKMYFLWLRKANDVQESARGNCGDRHS
ncbi:hypothetical protein [Vibrio gallaecicus]|uniref:hypothetical protein n=1 Tax=Vibrio gallaecicus TaxID=552386 RepID=UPI0025B51C54|nr:hypothetical protein [Vibrio gallaecicus]MDN3614191.1 hypothetical protein [Vibrio gallaecicus]